MFAVIDGVEHLLDASRDPELVKDAEEILLNRVLAQCKFLSNLLVGKTLSNQSHHLFFPRCEQTASGSAQDTQGGHLGDRLKRVVNLLRVSPDLSAVDDLDTFTEQAKRILREAEQSAHRFSPEKNCHLLIEAYERLDTSVRLVLAGGASASDSYAESLRKHVSERVLLLDYVSSEEFDELLTKAMLFILPSDLEGLSLALLEAMGAGRCMLASDIPENRELVDGAGFLFESGSVSDLERMLRFLLSDDSARARAGQRAQQRVREQYLWPEIAAQVEAAYFDVLGWEQRSKNRSAVDRYNPPLRKPVRSESVTASATPNRRA
jgi:glycosyltransferase involved in cell wall biosynthesis